MGPNSEQHKMLKQHMKAAKFWAQKIRKSGLSKGDTNGLNMEEIRTEMEGFCIDMVEEREMVNNATAGYCLCRKPYSGFMIGCDTCDEWYHGLCVNITEQAASKMVNFVCLRCNIAKTYKEGATVGLDICNKWLSRRELIKQRNLQHAKLQKKWRKEQRDLNKKIVEQDDAIIKYEYLAFGKKHLPQQPWAEIKLDAAIILIDGSPSTIKVKIRGGDRQTATGGEGHFRGSGASDC